MPPAHLAQTKQRPQTLCKQDPLSHNPMTHIHAPDYFAVAPEKSAGSDSIAAQRQLSPHNNHLVPWLSFEGGILKEQQTSFFTSLVLPNLARMFNGQQQTTFPTQQFDGSGPKSLDKGPAG